MFWETGREHGGQLNPLDSLGKRHVYVMVHLVCARFKMVGGHLDAGTKSLLGVLEA